ncbi:RusA family crossover junction endodeoxyribonuclease [Brevibacillus laterosporus]|nr:RusA family crossover junction endodeoxyribonuclease [Brevibacillus laterosporus]
MVLLNKKKFRLTSPMPPSVNHYLGYRAVPKKKKGRTVYIVVPYLTKEARDYKEMFSKYAMKQVKEQGWDIEKTRNRHYYMDCVYYFPRIDMDEQNYPKCMSDALNGITYIDDNFILTRANRIYYDKKNPRVEIEISEVDYIGIFDNEKELIEFENKCKTCARYKRNCSILKKAKEGRIQEEIDEGKNCIKFSRLKKER